MARLVLLLALWLTACGSDVPPTVNPAPTAAHVQGLIDAAIETHGGSAYERARIHFTFRDVPYTVMLDGGRFVYTRTTQEERGVVQDVLDNDGLRRTVGGTPVTLDAQEAAEVLTAVNSVPYFALLPYRLRDPAVVATYAGPDTVRGEPYERVAVSFTREGGGPDHEDAYLYWFHRDRHTMDYLAYSYSPDGTPYQSRFRVAFNPRTVGGIRFADYYNLAAPHALLEGDLTRYGTLYDAGRLDTISVIATEHVEVTPLPLSDAPATP